MDAIYYILVHHLSFSLEIRHKSLSHVTGNGTPIRQVLGKSKMILGLLEGFPTMFSGEVAMVMWNLFM